MRVLVTGATGFVGRHVVSKLLDRGHSVTAVARDENRAQELDWFRQVRFVPFDIYQPSFNSPALFGHPDAVIHLAWSGLPNYKALFHFETNLPADYRFLTTLVEQGVQQIIVSGTCLEYGMQNGCLAEDLPTQPANPYAIAKDTLRKFLEEFLVARDVVLQWARFFYMYGPGQNERSLLSQLDRALDRGDKIFNMSGGDQLRDYLSVEEVASRIVTLMIHPSCKGLVNICSEEPTSVRSIVERHIAQRGAAIDLNRGYYPYPDYEPMAFWGNGRKYREHCNG